MIGKRILLKAPINELTEVTILEVAPSEKAIKLAYPDCESWIVLNDSPNKAPCELYEVLDSGENLRLIETPEHTINATPIENPAIVVVLKFDEDYTCPEIQQDIVLSKHGKIRGKLPTDDNSSVIGQRTHQQMCDRKLADDEILARMFFPVM